MDEVVGVLCMDFSMNVRKLDYYQSYYEDWLSLLLLLLLLLVVVVVVVGVILFVCLIYDTFVLIYSD